MAQRPRAVDAHRESKDVTNICTDTFDRPQLGLKLARETELDSVLVVTRCRSYHKAGGQKDDNA